MKFFKKIFKNLTAGKTRIATPDNTRLFDLLSEYSKDNNYNNYKKVVEELTDGNAYLLLASGRNYDTKYNNWTSAEYGQTMDLEIYFVDGLKAIAAFTSEQALFSYKKKVTKYLALPSKALIEICETNSIDRIVVDSNLPTMVILQRDKD